MAKDKAVDSKKMPHNKKKTKKGKKGFNEAKFNTAKNKVFGIKGM